MKLTIRDYVPDLTPFSADEIINAGRRRQRKRRLRGVAGSLVAIVLVVIIAARLVPSGREGKPVEIAASTVVPTAATLSPVPSVSNSPTCPSPTPSGGVHEVVAYKRMVVWRGVVYESVAAESGSPAQLLGVVPCNIADIQDRAQAVWRGTWPDGSSTFATVGTQIFSQTGEDQACALTLEFEGEWVLLRNGDC